MANKLDTPVQNPPKGFAVVTKVYPASSKLGKGASKSGGSISGPASGK